MTIKDWIFVLAISGLGMMTANFIGFDVAFTESLPACWCCCSLPCAPQAWPM